MSVTTAIVLYAPIEARLLPRLSRRYRAGIVMETLEVRRVLSAAVAAVELPDEALDESAIVVDDAGAADGELFGTCDLVMYKGGDDEEAGEPTDETVEEVGDPELYELMFTTAVGDVDGEVLDDSGVAWPEGWGWSLDRLPTQEEVDAANSGDDLGGLWVPVRTFGGDEDDIWTDDGEAWTDDGEIWTLDGDMIDDAGAADDGEPLENLADGEGLEDPNVIFYSLGGGLPNQRDLSADPTAAAGEDPAAAQVAGGAPTPIVFGTATSANGLLLGKLKLSVTGDDESDLPFMN